jgi:hypothetical protein
MTGDRPKIANFSQITAILNKLRFFSVQKEILPILAVLLAARST